jgi:aspartyl-tRNA(Asn)/glutamyl-tRNA(Gln) amidotransferase subunit A
MNATPDGSAPNRLGIAAAGRALRGGGLTATALTRACIDAIAARDADVGAFVHTCFDLALEQAAAADARLRRGAALGPLDGIPVALKDNIDVAGLPTGNGTGTRRQAQRDAAVVARLRRAGAVFPGKTNLHEAALGTTTLNPHTGATHNPLRHGFTPGGSSGGSAAAVAAGFALAALGTDTMGSIRIPAAYCGLTGFKPGHSLALLDGVVPLYTPMDHIGPICHDVNDAALTYAAMSGHDAGDDTIAAADLRLGRFVDLDALTLDGNVADVYRDAESRLLAGVASTRSLPPLPHEPAVARRAALLLMERDLFERLGGAALEDDRTYSAEFRALVAYGARADAQRLEAAHAIVQAMRDAVVHGLAGVDVAISATAPQTAFSFDDPVPSNQADLVAAASFAGCPAISLPCGKAANGLPVGLQLMAAPGREAGLLAAARALEVLIDRR